MLTKIGLASLACAVLAACQTCPPPLAPQVVEKPVTVDTACDWDAAIYIDPKGDTLTPETYKQIEKHNVAGAKRCGWKPKVKPQAQ